MSVRSGFCCAVLAIYVATAGLGCASGRQSSVQAQSATAPTPPAGAAAAASAGSAHVQRAAESGAQPIEPAAGAMAVSYRQSLPVPLPTSEPIAGQRFAPAELALSEYVQEVIGRNQSLQGMIAAWRAAGERYPQAVALDDPMLNTMTAPASWHSSEVTPAYVVGGSQKLPWMGKRPLRGQMAQSEANAAYMDVADARLQLVQTAELAYFEYYLVQRWLELNATNTRSLVEFRDTARRQYEANLVMQQDVLQAEVELSDLARRQFELERMNRIAIARLNTLVHRPPDDLLPPPPAALAVGEAPAPAEVLRQTALARRPDLAAIGARIEAQRAALRLAYKEFYPDLEVFGRYDSFWQPDSQRDLRSQVGVNMNVPIYLEKRRAAAREAMFKLRQEQAEYQQRIDDINNDVQAAYERVVEMRQAIELYNSRTLPAAAQNVQSARADYIAGKGDFLRLISAQRQLIGLQERQQQAIADYHSRLAELERAIGGPVAALKAD